METQGVPESLQLQQIDGGNKVDMGITVTTASQRLSGSALGANCATNGGAYVAAPRAKVGKIVVNRWVVFLLYCCYCLLAGPSFMNWTPIADMLYRSDAYLWECAPDKKVDPPPKPQEPKCSEQEIAVNHLFSVASCSYFVFAMLGGIMLDFAGPKLGAVTGLASLVLGWMLLAFSSEAFRAYVPAMVFIGAGIDMAFFPCLCGANLFPGFVSTIIALYGACRSLSFVSGLALREIFFKVPGATLRDTLLGFIGLGLGFCVIVALIVIPWTAWPPPEAEKGDPAGAENEARKETSSVLRPSSGPEGSNEGLEEPCGSSPLHPIRDQTTGSCTAARIREQTRESESQLLQRCGESASTGADMSGAQIDSLMFLQRRDAEEQVGIGVTHIAPASLEECLPQERSGRAEGEKASRNHAISRRGVITRDIQESLKSFVQDLISPAFIPLIPYFIFVLIDILFFTPTARRLIPQAYEANQIITVCGFAPCIVLGYLADRIGVIRVMIICNSAGLLSWVLLLIPGIPCYTASQYIVSLLLTLQMCFLVSQIYCYVTEVFPPKNLGKLIGFLCSVGGVISLVTSPMRNYSVQNTFYPMVILCLVFAASNEGFLAFMYYWQRRAKRVQRGRAALEEKIAEEKLAV